MKRQPDTPSATMGGRILLRGDAEGGYRLRLAGAPDEIRRAQALRFEVFNLELNEGLAESFRTGLDSDPFDEVCDHLLVEEAASGVVVGTYRLQSGLHAATARGYYSELEFDFGPFEIARPEIVELGRACVHALHRNLTVLGLLWKGITAYARAREARYLIGCSSLTSQDPRDGASMFEQLAGKHLVGAEWRTVPRATHVCPLDQKALSPPKVPRLLAAYLSIGAKICGPPAIDREFKTIDFLTFVDLKTLPRHIIRRYLS